MLILFFKGHLKASAKHVKVKKIRSSKKSGRMQACIFCGSLLEEGGRIVSHEYKGEKESIVNIFGCPRCYGKRASMDRICPICKKLLKDEDHLMGKMWEENGKKRLHVGGCTHCYGK